jgi:hypothetical protein
MGTFKNRFFCGRFLFYRFLNPHLQWVNSGLKILCASRKTSYFPPQGKAESQSFYPVDFSFKDFKVFKVSPFGVASRYAAAKSRLPACRPAFVAKRELRFYLRRSEPLRQVPQGRHIINRRLRYAQPTETEPPLRQVPQGRHFINRRWSVAQPTETKPRPFGIASRYPERRRRPI